MPVHAGRGLTQNQPNSFILLDGASRPLMLVGEIVRQSSQGRDSPPGCISGFETMGTAFARGHIMALELGGCDDSQNIVPQYGVWQGSPQGAWRAMERTLAEADLATQAVQQVMVVAIDYTIVAPHVTDAERLAFALGEKLRHFVDPRIPTRFKVWAVPKAWSSGTVSIDAFFKAPNKEPLFAPLFGALDGVATVLDETINAMPQVDRDYWKGQMLRGKVRDAYDVYAAEQQKKVDDWFAALAPPPKPPKPGDPPKKGGGPMRAPRRATMAAKASAMPYTPGPRPDDPLKLHKWANDPNTQSKVVQWLKGPPAQLPGWSPVELAQLQPQHVDEAVFP